MFPFNPQELDPLAPLPAKDSRPTLRGHLELTCSPDGRGRSRISRQSFCAPFHISKSYCDEHTLVVQVVNPTAGLFAGDALRCEVNVESGARLRVSTPAATRIHTMTNGQAFQEQKFRVANGAWLEFHPSPIIPQRNSRYRQKTEIEMEEGGELFVMETLAPGRVAHGECFQFTEIDWECNLRQAHRLIARERYILRPKDGILPTLVSLFPQSYHASGYLVTEQVSDADDCWRQINELNSEDALVGASRLISAGWNIKVLARDSLSLESTIKSLRRILSASLPQLRSDPRKL